MDEGMKQQGLNLVEHVGQLVMPGDEFSMPQDLSKLILGPGLKLITDRRSTWEEGGVGTILACKPGVLAKVKGNTFFVEVKSKQYDSYKKDDVLGVIKQKGKGDQYTCDVGTKERAHLSKFAFEGATKRFRPDLQVGDVIYGKVVELPPDFPMELTCVHGTGKSLGLGVLESGHVFQIPVHFTRLLRSASDSVNVLRKIGRIVPCETAVGVNGLIWVKAKNAVLTILVCQLITKLSQSSVAEHEQILKQFRKGISSLAM